MGEPKEPPMCSEELYRMSIGMKYSILLSIVGGRSLLLELTANSVALLEAALFFFSLFLTYHKHVIPYLKPLGPDELENSLFIRFLKGSHIIYYVTSPVGAGPAPCIKHIHVFAANHLIHVYSC